MHLALERVVSERGSHQQSRRPTTQARPRSGGCMHTPMPMPTPFAVGYAGTRPSWSCTYDQAPDSKGNPGFIPVTSLIHYKQETTNCHIPEASYRIRQERPHEPRPLAAQLRWKIWARPSRKTYWLLPHCLSPMVAFLIRARPRPLFGLCCYC